MRVDERPIPDDYEEKIQKSADYVSLKNGVLNLKKLKLLAHNKKFLIFYSLDADWIEDPESRRVLRDSYLLSAVEILKLKLES